MGRSLVAAGWDALAGGGAVRADKHWLDQPEPGARWLSRRELALRIAGVIAWVFLVIVIIGATQPARAATSADVKREISGAFERSEISNRRHCQQ